MPELDQKHFSRREVLSLLSGVGLVAMGCDRSGTLPEGKSLRFVVASDGHYGEPGTEYQQFYEELIASVNRQHQEKPLDFVLINGDLVHGTRPELLPEVKSHLDRLPVPYYVVRGNHDRVSVSAWQQLWGYSTNHVVLTDKAAFILLDTSNENGEYYCGDTAWFESALGSVPDGLPVFVFMHIPFIRSFAGGTDCTDVNEIMGRFPNIKAIFHGHDHSIDEGIQINNKAVFFDGRLGSSWGTNYRGYRVVEQTRDGKYLSWQYDLENSRRVNQMTF